MATRRISWRLHTRPSLKFCSVSPGEIVQWVWIQYLPLICILCLYLASFAASRIWELSFIYWTIHVPGVGRGRTILHSSIRPRSRSECNTGWKKNLLTQKPLFCDWVYKHQHRVWDVCTVYVFSKLDSIQCLIMWRLNNLLPDWQVIHTFIPQQHAVNKDKIVSP